MNHWGARSVHHQKQEHQGVEAEAEAQAEAQARNRTDMDALKAAVPNIRSQAGPALAWARNHDKGEDEVSRGHGGDKDKDKI